MTEKASQAKIKHHYVWGSYLRQWSLNNRDIFYTTKKGKIAFDSVKGIAREHNFYRVKWLTDVHVEVIKSFSRLSPDYLQKYHMLCLNRFLEFQNRNIHDIEASIIFECNGLEDLHTFNENEAKIVMQALAMREINILTSDNNMLKFCIYLGHQHSRTKSFRENILNWCATLIGKEHPQVGRALEECSWFLSYIIGMNFGVDLFNTRLSDKHCLLLNDTELPFVTSDQPIVNVFGAFEYVDVKPPQDDELELYYPISPSVAYVISKTGRFKQGENTVSRSTVDELNTKLSLKSDAFIVSNTSDALRPLIKKRGAHAKQFRQLFEQEVS